MLYYILYSIFNSNRISSTCFLIRLGSASSAMLNEKGCNVLDLDISDRVTCLNEINNVFLSQSENPIVVLDSLNCVTENLLGTDTCVELLNRLVEFVHSHQGYYRFKLIYN